jgi:hypothetical protein
MAYIGCVFGIMFGVTVGALIAQSATSWIANFKPRYRTALLSSVLAYGVALCMVFVLGASGLSFDKTTADSLRVLLGAGVLACSHITFLQSEAGDRLTVSQSIAVAVSQLIGTLLAAALLILVVLVPVLCVRRFLL